MSSIVSLTEDDSDAAGVLIAARHARERQLFRYFSTGSSILPGPRSWCSGR